MSIFWKLLLSKKKYKAKETLDLMKNEAARKAVAARVTGQLMLCKVLPDLPTDLIVPVLKSDLGSGKTFIECFKFDDTCTNNAFIKWKLLALMAGHKAEICVLGKPYYRKNPDKKAFDQLVHKLVELDTSIGTVESYRNEIACLLDDLFEVNKDYLIRGAEFNANMIGEVNLSLSSIGVIQFCDDYVNLPVSFLTLQKALVEQ